MADPDPQIRGGEGQSSRPSDEGGPGLQKNFIRPSGLILVEKKEVGGGGSPGSATGIIVVWFKLLKSRIRNCNFSNNTIS